MPTGNRTRAEILEKVREFQRQEHERKVRAGRAKPRNYREMEMFAVDLLGPREEPDASDES
ncbi:hypothetical protein [Nocardiopsis sp. NRRL B-16309]|uniref:hypothetical protein n=1 Tax=Nocardiopsis sp. NRRL B-16309 TaxID=1519494 RepID=UPI000AE3C239|nr:hypothetical protein [Nocardiopsis sp. NRRL B-16309]